ncbi:unnamed protein product [Ectocarpus fasciculatus]
MCSSSFLSSWTRCGKMLEMLLILLLGLSVLLDSSAVNECLDSTDAAYRCQTNSTDGSLDLGECGITDDDFDDLPSCLEAAGPETIISLYLNRNNLATLPEGSFGGLTTLEFLFLSRNELTTLPEGIFGDLVALQVLSLSMNELTTLPEGIFGDLVALQILYLYDNNLTTLPEEIFQGLSNLTMLRLDGNSLECLPSTTLVEVDDDATDSEVGLYVDEYGDECGCSIDGVTDSVCGQETCTPGDEGYTCACPSEPRCHLLRIILLFQGSADDGLDKEVAVAVGVAVGVLALAALGFFLRRRRAAKRTDPGPRAPPSDGGDSLGYGQAVLAAADELVHHCQIPGVSEAAAAVLILIHLVLDSRDLTSRGEAEVKRCRSIVMILKRAAKVLGKGGDTSTEEERVLIEEVQDAVSDLVELIQTYQNKSRLGQVLTSTLFKRRQNELNAVLDRAIWGLHLGLQVQVGHDVGQVGDDVAHLVKRSTAEAQAQTESLAEARRSRRQRKLDQIEIPEDHVSITNEVLGKGGFGVVYLADYNGHNAAAKVQHITHGLGTPGENDIPLGGPRTVGSNALREKVQRKAFLRELDAMIRLRNPHIVNVYGAITSLPDRLVLVMELLAGGDLRSMLENPEQPLPEDKCRQIIQDVCAGMAFLHSKATVHGDLKSANVLLDGSGRAKACWIADFGTSRWAQNTERSTGLATYTTNPGPSAHISFAWTAPEVLVSNKTSKASDVYSFGMVAWEVLTRHIPWADEARPRDIYLRVVMREERPAIPADAPVDIAEMIRRCWAQEPEDRLTFPMLCNGGNVRPTAPSTYSS